MWSAYIYIDMMGFSKHTDTTFNQAVLEKHLFSSLQNNNNKNDHIVQHSSSHTQNYPSSSHTCQPIQFTGIKSNQIIIFGGYGYNYWKMDTGKHYFYEMF